MQDWALASYGDFGKWLCGWVGVGPHLLAKRRLTVPRVQIIAVVAISGSSASTLVYLLGRSLGFGLLPS